MFSSRAWSSSFAFTVRSNQAKAHSTGNLISFIEISNRSTVPYPLYSRQLQVSAAPSTSHHNQQSQYRFSAVIVFHLQAPHVGTRPPPQEIHLMPTL